jgi:hypothetical protein
VKSNHSKRQANLLILNGAPIRIRTRDPLITNQVLYQLSYKGSALQIAPLARACKPQISRVARASRPTAARPTAVTSKAAGAASPIRSRLASS